MYALIDRQDPPPPSDTVLFCMSKQNMSTEIPLKIRVAIRDQWESSRAPIRHSIDALTKALGQPITTEVDWPALYSTLKDVFPEPSTFVPAIYRIAVAFYGRLLSAIEKESNKEWKERFLENFGPVVEDPALGWRLQIKVTLHDKSVSQRPKLVWNIAGKTFCINLPKRKPAGNAVIEAGFDEDLKNLFGIPLNLELTDPSTPTTSAEDTIVAPSTSSSAVQPRSAASDKSATSLGKEKSNDIPPSGKSKEQVKQKTPPTGKSTWPHLATQEEKSEAMKPEPEKSSASDVSTRPSRLFRHISPCVLIVDAETVPLRVQCSHQPTLEHMASYFKKWVRIDPNSLLEQPLLKIELVESSFFAGVYDSITIEPAYNKGDQKPLNPVMILGCVEGILGFKEVFTNGTRWTFKRYKEASKTSLHDRSQRSQTP